MNVIFFSAVLVVFSAYSAVAQGIDAQIEGAKLCTRNLARYERHYGIPSHLLSAISATESGRYHQGLKITLPWPWTINVEGQGHYFDSKQEAVAAVRRFQRQGARSIDVGCMQVNLVHHPEAFANLDEAFDPQRNVAYGAGFLRGLYDESKSWKQAAADYHSKTPRRGKEYVGRVFDRWTNILTRLREAKNERDGQAKTEIKTASAGNGAVFLNEKNSQALPLPPRKKNPAAKAKTKMNQIAVRSVETRQFSRDNGVLIIRPEVRLVDNAATVSAATVSDAVAPEIPPLAPVAKVIRVAEARRVVPSPVAAVAASEVAQFSAVKSSGPRFIFDN